MPNLMYATGHYRNGVLLAPLTAQLVADAMLDNRIDPMLAPVSPARFGFWTRSLSASATIVSLVGRARRAMARAREREDTGDPFGIECAGATRTRPSRG